MKSLMKQWRMFLLEGATEYSGILKIKPDVKILSEMEAMQSMLPEEAVRIKPEDFHVTLVHQSILKPFANEMKVLDFPDPPAVILDEEVFERKSPGKKSWAVRLVNQEEMREYVKNIMEMLGSQNTNPEPERVFHVSLANLTGNPHDSVR
jgi:hypothetical protein